MAKPLLAEQQTAAVSAKKKMEPNRTTFTPLALKHLPIPKPKLGVKGQMIVAQRDFWDASEPSFGLRVSSTGRKVWTMMARMPQDGKLTLRRFTLGPYSKSSDDGGLTLAEARRKAGGFRNAIARGEDPARQKEDAKQKTLRESGQTFRTIAEEFLATHHPKKKTALKPSTLRRYTGLLLGDDVKHWEDRPVAGLTRADVIEVMHRMQKRTGPNGAKLTVSVNRMLRVLQKFFRWCIQRDLIELSPANDIQPPEAEIPRERHLFGDTEHDQPSELALLWKASHEIGIFGGLVKLLLLTGQRRDEVAGMRHSELIELDGPNPRWSIPAARTKNSKKHLVPLTPTAVQVIQSMPKVVNSDFVFTTTGNTAFSGFSNLKDKLDRRIEDLKKNSPAQYGRQFADEWRLHDLRRTVKTGLAELKVRADVRDAVLNHTKTGVDKHYDHSQLHAEKREALTLWEQYVLGLVHADGQPIRKKAGRVTRGRI